MLSSEKMQFITRHNYKLYQGSNEYRFLSYNTPNLAVIEDPFWHRSSSWEQSDLLNSILLSHGKVVRIYPFSIHKQNPSHFTYNSQNQSWILNSDLFQDLDQALVLANQRDIRVIIPFIDYWDWWGGIPTMSHLVNSSNNLDFYSDPMVRSLTKSLIQMVLYRNNSISGVPYYKDPTILAWETGNELSWSQKSFVPAEWSLDICEFIRSIDSHHLIMDGSFGKYGWDPQVLGSPCIDILSNHYYIGHFMPSLELGTVTDVVFLFGIIFGCMILVKKARDHSKSNRLPLLILILCILFTIAFLTYKLLSGTLYSLENQFKKDLQIAKRHNKSFVIGEFGLTPVYPMQLLLDRFVLSTASGALLWSLRGQSESGGFYTHKELHGYYAYHYPGLSASSLVNGFGSDEVQVMKMMKDFSLALNPTPSFTPSNDLLGTPLLWAITDSTDAYKLYLKGVSGSDAYELYHSNSLKNSNYTLVYKFNNALPSGSWFYSCREVGWYKVRAYPSLIWSDSILVS